MTGATRPDAVQLPVETIEGPGRETAVPARRAVTPSAHPRARAKPGSLLAARAANEYVYVSRDLRKILAVAAVLFAILVGLWAVLVLMGVSPLY